VQPPVVPRSSWGAAEPLRLDLADEAASPPARWPTQKLIVHHTAGGNDHPDSAAALRWIHRFHTETRGWDDLGYNFVIDKDGVIFEGRFSGSRRHGDPVGIDRHGKAVAAAHTGGFNAGTISVALLGNFCDSTFNSAARGALVRLLAWAAEISGLDPEGSGPYVNPLSAAHATLPNIAGHRDIAATACPGDHLYAALPGIRAEVAALAPPVA
jgi:hypothetical protein